MRPHGRGALWIFVVGVLGACAVARADAPRPSPYAPYAFLIGEWNVTSESGGPPVAVARFRWGTNQSYIWYAGSMLVGGVEHPHFEGLLMWNGVSGKLDMLLSMDLERGLVQEQGVVSVERDGTVVREITASYSEGSQPIGKPPAGPEGVKARFRQTFRAAGTDRILTTVMREAGGGWVATFPGSDRLVMTRRPKG